MFTKGVYEMFAKSFNYSEIEKLGLAINEVKLIYKIKEIYERFYFNLSLAQQLVDVTYKFWFIKVQKLTKN